MCTCIYIIHLECVWVNSGEWTQWKFGLDWLSLGTTNHCLLLHEMKYLDMFGLLDQLSWWVLRIYLSLVGKHHLVHHLALSSVYFVPGWYPVPFLGSARCYALIHILPQSGGHNLCCSLSCACFCRGTSSGIVKGQNLKQSLWLERVLKSFWSLDYSSWRWFHHFDSFQLLEWSTIIGSASFWLDEQYD